MFICQNSIWILMLALFWIWSFYYEMISNLWLNLYWYIERNAHQYILTSSCKSEEYLHFIEKILNLIFRRTGRFSYQLKWKWIQTRKCYKMCLVEYLVLMLKTSNKIKLIEIPQICIWNKFVVLSNGVINITMLVYYTGEGVG